MKLNKTIEIDNKALMLVSFDAIICASGFEDRCTFFVSQNKKLIDRIPRKYCLGFEGESFFSKQSNDALFAKNNFELITSNGDLFSNVFDLLNKITDQCKNNEINLLVDYSSMTRVWYAEILNYFNTISLKIPVNIYFSYSYSKYQKAPEEVSNNVHVGPISGFSNLSTPHKPTALIIGLGYEKNRAYGLTEYLDAESFIFYTDNGKSSKFENEIEKANSELISKLNKKNIYRYPINDLKYTEFLLTTLCYDLSDNYRIIIAPCGPKPFTLTSLIVASKNNEIDVWRISPGKEAPPFNKIADGEINILKVTYGK